MEDGFTIRNNHVQYVKLNKGMFLGGIMLSFINKKVIFAVAVVVAVLLVLEPTTDITMAVLRLPSKAAWMILGFVFSIINWPVLIMMVSGFAIGFVIKTRTIDWDVVKAYFNKEEA
jgi:hypothetical protein